MSCAHCQTKDLEIAELRAALGLSGRLTDQRTIGRRFGLTAAESKVIHALYQAHGRVVPAATLDEAALSRAAARRASDVLKVHVHRLRRKLGSDAIETAEGGYALSAVGRARVYQALHASEAARG